MLDALQEYLRTATSLEYQVQVEEAHSHFERFGLQDYELAFMDLMMTVDSTDSSAVQDELTGLITNLQRNILNQFQVTLADDLSISAINEILKFISDIEYTELVDDVCNIIDGQGDSTDKFCQLIGLLNSKEPEHYYDIVHDASESLLIKIKEIVQKNQEDDVDNVLDVEQNRQLLKALRVFMDTVGTKPAIVYNLMIDGMPPGLEFKQYYEKIVPFIATSDSRRAAYELIAATKICKPFEQNPRELILEHLNQTFANIDIVTPFLVAVDQTLIDFNHKLNSGIQKVTS